MNFTILTSLAVVMILSICAATSCSSVPAGHVGVVVHKMGGSKGVDVEERPVGRYWLGINDEMFTFPTFTQTMVWTKDKTEGSPNDDSFTFQSVEGMSINTDVGITYHIDPTHAAQVFQKYRKGVKEITDVVLRSSVRNAFASVGSVTPIEDIYGKGKTEMVTKAAAQVRADVEPNGIIIESLYLTGEMRLPASVTQAINAKIQATQIAQQRENEIAQTKAQALKEIAQAEGEAQAKLTIAKAAADSVRLQGDAEAAAIKAKSDALNASPQLVAYELARQWDGKLPTTTGAAIPLLNLK